MQLKLAPKRFASASRGLRQFRRAHVVRRRVDEVARQRGRFRHPHDIGDVDAVGRHQPDVRRIGLAIAAEAVAAEREGERGEPRIVRRVGEAIDARRQQARQRAGPEQVARFAPSSSRPNSTCAICPSAAGRIRHLPGLAVKSLAAANCRAGSGRLFEIAAHVVLVAKVIGMAEVAGAVSNGECMRFSIETRRAGCRGFIARPINQPLGLTVYCWRVRLLRPISVS